MSEPEIKQPTCPWCGAPPGLVVSIVQVFCGNDECAAWAWNPSRTAVDNIASVGVVKLSNLLRGEADE